ncbi:hypothetical protein [Arthrobacter sedimenti]|uniref:hypothetical protein n=1 Tax=Arthrobacter sedimenti TaxID=2694931 RepID=UPI000B34E909|nr:hypothetical protein [Arthrobacter sedimenti]OUM40153.1 hypothetical protein B8W73_17305 [Arthrobacter agilis]
MSETPRRRYRVRLRRAVAGSFLAAATAASAIGLAAAPALAVPPAVVAGLDSLDSSDSSDSSDFSDSSDYEARTLILGTRPGSSPHVVSAATAGGAISSAERLAGVRADLDRAVLLRLVTPEQADGFYAQIERRVAAGL